MSLTVLEKLIGEFVERTYGCFGNLARTNHTFFSLEMVALSMAPLREALADGKRLTPRGERFASCAAAQLAYLAFLGFQRRGLETSASVSWHEEPEQRRMGIFASRPSPEGDLLYGQDFLQDLGVLLEPSDPFPGPGEGSVLLAAEREVPVEYLYQIGVHLMMSPRARGSWPRRPDEKEMGRGLRSLVDDLAVDLHLAPGDPVLERLCAAAVWPPAGWPGNTAQERNLAQVVRRAREDEEKGEAFLRALLRAQLTSLRHLAARALLTLGRGPRDHEETAFFSAAMEAPGALRCFRAMGELRWAMEEQDEVPVAFLEDSEKEWRQMVEAGPRPPWRRSPVLEDPLYSVGRGNPGSADASPEVAHQLLRRYPDDWWALVILGRSLLNTGETVAGSRILRQAAAESEGDLTAHETLSRFLLRRKRLAEADQLARQAVELQPWNEQAVRAAIDTTVRGYFK